MEIEFTSHIIIRKDDQVFLNECRKPAKGRFYDYEGKQIFPFVITTEKVSKPVIVTNHGNVSITDLYDLYQEFRKKINYYYYYGFTINFSFSFTSTDFLVIKGKFYTQYKQQVLEFLEEIENFVK